MSLINDALKRAQKQRTGEVPPLAAMPGVGGESAARIARSSRPGGADSMMLWGAGVGAGVILLLVGGYLAFRPSSAEKSLPTVARHSPDDVQDKSRADSQQRESGGQTPGVQQGTTVPSPSSQPPAVTFVLPIAPTPKVEAPAVVRKTEDRESGSVVNPPASAVVQKSDPAPSAAPVAPSKPVPAPKLEPRALTYIESIRVMGIRASATDSKVLMNDRVYRVGDTVEHEMGLKIVGITANSLTFEDEHGGRFTRTF